MTCPIQFIFIFLFLKEIYEDRQFIFTPLLPAETSRACDSRLKIDNSNLCLCLFFTVFGNQDSNRYLINPKSTEGLMKLLDTFLLTITCRANIVLISSSVEQYLGHCRVSIVRQLT